MIYRAISNQITELSNAWLACQYFWPLLHTLNRRAELERLIAWATRKRLTGPREFYRSRLLDEEMRLSRYAITAPRWVVTLAYLLHNFNRLAFPPRRYMRRGAAAPYSSKTLTCPDKAYSISNTVK